MTARAAIVEVLRTAHAAADRLCPAAIRDPRGPLGLDVMTPARRGER